MLAPQLCPGSYCITHISLCAPLRFLGEAARVPKAKTPQGKFPSQEEAARFKTRAESPAAGAPASLIPLLLPLPGASRAARAPCWCNLTRSSGGCRFSSIMFVQRQFTTPFPGEVTAGSHPGEMLQLSNPSWELSPARGQERSHSRAPGQDLLPPRRQLTKNSSEVVLSANHLCSLATLHKEVQVSHC